jgi:hypothetical protein
MHTYSVALRISGTDLDVDEVSAKLRLKPTQTRVIGQPRYSDKSVWSESMWEYDVRPSEGKVVWDSLEDGLRTLLSAFVSREVELREISSDTESSCGAGTFRAASAAARPYPRKS